MPERVAPGFRFRALGRAEVEAALADPDPENEIAVEVARLVAGYTANLKAHVERLGQVPADVLRRRPRYSIEAVAMELTTAAIREALDKP